MPFTSAIPTIEFYPCKRIMDFILCNVSTVNASSKTYCWFLMQLAYSLPHHWGTRLSLGRNLDIGALMLRLGQFHCGQPQLRINKLRAIPCKVIHLQEHKSTMFRHVQQGKKAVICVIYHSGVHWETNESCLHRTWGKFGLIRSFKYFCNLWNDAITNDTIIFRKFKENTWQYSQVDYTIIF